MRERVGGGGEGRDIIGFYHNMNCWNYEGGTFIEKTMERGRSWEKHRYREKEKEIRESLRGL